jgi:hypothetical protein
MIIKLFQNRLEDYLLLELQEYHHQVYHLLEYYHLERLEFLNYLQ